MSRRSKIVSAIFVALVFILAVVAIVFSPSMASATEPSSPPRPEPIVSEVAVGEPVVDCETGFVTTETRTESIDFELVGGAWVPLPAEVIGYASSERPVTVDECPPADDYVPDFTPTETATPAPLPADEEPIEGLAVTGPEGALLGSTAAGLAFVGIIVLIGRRLARH